MKAIEAPTCVDAWLQASDYLLSHDRDDWRAYNVVMEVADPFALPQGDRAVLSLVNAFLMKRGGLPIDSVINTIFPASLYRRHGATGLVDRYLNEVYPALKRHPDWHWGTYAQRLFQRFDHTGSEVRPLETLVSKLRSQVALNGPRRAVYELGTIDLFMDIPIYDPNADRNRPIGGPCLTHLSVKLTADRRVILTGFYRSHFYVQRTLGNLLGLAHLQHFIAKETGLTAGPLVCHSSMAQLELKPRHWGKAAVAELIAQSHAARQSTAA